MGKFPDFFTGVEFSGEIFYSVHIWTLQPTGFELKTAKYTRNIKRVKKSVSQTRLEVSRKHSLKNIRLCSKGDLGSMGINLTESKNNKDRIIKVFKSNQ